MARPRWRRAIKSPFSGTLKGFTTIWVQNDKQIGETCVPEHCVALDMDIASDHMERYLSPDAAIDLGLALIEIGRKVKTLQLQKR